MILFSDDDRCDFAQSMRHNDGFGGKLGVINSMRSSLISLGRQASIARSPHFESKADKIAASI